MAGNVFHEPKELTFQIPGQYKSSNMHPKASCNGILTNLRIISVVLLIVNHLFKLEQVEASFKRCFTCRSRGPLGDCRDPLTLNSTTFDKQMSLKPSIEAVPCSSGWCSKIIEDEYGDSIKATERSCMTRPPTDNEERCSETLFENHRDRKVFLCMCYGDLCNGAAGFGLISLPYSLVSGALGSIIVASNGFQLHANRLRRLSVGN